MERNHEDMKRLEKLVAKDEQTTRELLDTLKSASDKQNLELFSASKKGDIFAVENALNNGADVNARDTKGRSSLIFAVGHGHDSIVDILLKKGASANEENEEIGNDGVTVLMLALARGYKGIVELLLDSGANINAKDTSGATALMHAVLNKQFDIMRILIDRGADINVRNNTKGNTPLIFAAIEGYSEGAKLLIREGADPNIKNYDGYTALTFAKSSGHYDIVNMFKSVGAR
ncbi:MAG: hypothetical protein GY749_10890 [Desulfobacteraceae bacterium]|nr:hypothetical protein [Desulfobacteraceae bacterium]